MGKLRGGFRWMQRKASDRTRETERRETNANSTVFGNHGRYRSQLMEMDEYLSSCNMG